MDPILSYITDLTKEISISKPTVQNQLAFMHLSGKTKKDKEMTFYLYTAVNCQILVITYDYKYYLADHYPKKVLTLICYSFKCNGLQTPLYNSFFFDIVEQCLRK